MQISGMFRMISFIAGAAVALLAMPVLAADIFTIGVCQVAKPGLNAQIQPEHYGNVYLQKYHNEDPQLNGFTFNDNSTKASVVKAPAHGKVEHVDSRISSNYYKYSSKKSYLGKDKFVMQVERNGIKVQIQYLIEIVSADKPTNSLCKPQFWRVS